MDPSGTRRSLILAGSLSFLLGLAGEATAQTTIEGGPECGSCSISMVSMERIGGDESSDSWIPFFPRDAELIEGDRIALTFLSGHPPVWHSWTDDRSGAIGRMGEGPGEYQWASVIKRLPGDSLLIFDLLRATVTDPEGEYVRSLRLDVVAREAIILSWPDNVVVAADMTTPTHAGYSLHTLDLTGSVAERVRSFAENRPYFANRAKRYERIIAPSPRGGFVAAKAKAYEIVRYSDDGSVTDSWIRVADWAPTNAPSILGGPQHAPTWRLSGLHVDERDRLWVFTQVGRPDWRDVWRATGVDELPDSGDVDGSLGPRIWDLMLTRVEVLDLDRGVVVAQEDFQEFVYHVLADGRVVLASDTEGGVPLLHLAELRLDGAD